MLCQDLAVHIAMAKSNVRSRSVQAVSPGRTTEVFICWSGARSQKLAAKLQKFLVRVMPALRGRVFFSPQAEKGARWFDEVVRHLAGAKVGLICLTAENLSAPWLHFEAGVLLRGLSQTTPTPGLDEATEDRVFAYLHGVTAASLSGPLSQYQGTTTTRADTRRMIRTLATILRQPENSRDLFDKYWPDFERELQTLHVTVPELLPNAERWFRRKTFEEPVQQCTDQNWLGRYDGARQTHDVLDAHLASVQAACPRPQADLYRRLLMLIDSYAMDIRALLVGAPKYALNEQGELQIPPGILQACERRRSQIKDVVTRLLDPLAVPATEEAVKFWLSDDSFDLRKVTVHRCEASIFKSPAPVPDVDTTHGLFDSLWDLDRIYGYLLTQYRYQNDKNAIEQLCQAATAELERFNAGSTATLMPLYYSLRALRTVLDARARSGRKATSARIQGVLDEVRRLMDESRRGSRPPLDSGGQVRRVMKDIDGRLARQRRPRRPRSRARRSRR